MADIKFDLSLKSITKDKSKLVEQIKDFIRTNDDGIDVINYNGCNKSNIFNFYYHANQYPPSVFIKDTPHISKTTLGINPFEKDLNFNSNIVVMYYQEVLLSCFNYNLFNRIDYNYNVAKDIGIEFKIIGFKDLETDNDYLAFSITDNPEFDLILPYNTPLFQKENENVFKVYSPSDYDPEAMLQLIDLNHQLLFAYYRLSLLSNYNRGIDGSENIDLTSSVKISIEHEHNSVPIVDYELEDILTNPLNYMVIPRLSPYKEINIKNKYSYPIQYTDNKDKYVVMLEISTAYNKELDKTDRIKIPLFGIKKINSLKTIDRF